MVSDYYYHINKFVGGNNNPNEYNQLNINACQDFYDDVKSYDKKLFPIKGNLTDYSFNKDNEFHVLTLAELLKARDKMVYQWLKLPDFVKRNMGKGLKEIIYNDNQSNDNIKYEFSELSKQLKEINDLLKILPEKKYNEMLPKLFGSTKSLENIKNAVENIRNTMSFIKNDEINKDYILDMVDSVNADIVSDKNNVLVIKINDVEAMQTVGCFTSWCFAIPGGEGRWNEYAELGYVYIIYDLNIDIEDARFIMVYLPDVDTLFMGNNIPLEDVYPETDTDNYLKSIGVDVRSLR